MRLLGQILLVCVLFSVLQALVAVIAIAFMLLLVWGLLFRTRETVGFVALCLLIEALQVHPFVTIGLIVLLTGAFLIARADPSPPERPVGLLAPPSTPPD